MNNNHTIHIFGDSVMKGVLYDENIGKYVISETSPAEEFSKINGIDARNRSVFGCTVTKGSKILTTALEKGLEGPVLIEYGGNDCNFNWAEVAAAPDRHHEPATPEKTFEMCYREMIDRVKERGLKPVVMNLPPIDASKYFAWITRDGLCAENILRWLGDKQMIYRFQELYSDIITRIAYATGTLLIDVRSCFLGRHNYTDYFCVDGIHPNRRGQTLIFQALSDSRAAIFA